MKYNICTIDITSWHSTTTYTISLRVDGAVLIIILCRWCTRLQNPPTKWEARAGAWRSVRKPANRINRLITRITYALSQLRFVFIGINALSALFYRKTSKKILPGATLIQTYIYPFISRKDQFISWDRPLIAQIQTFCLSLCLKWQARAYSASKNSVKWQFVISGCCHIFPSNVTSEVFLFLSIAYICPSKCKVQ